MAEFQWRVCSFMTYSVDPYRNASKGVCNLATYSVDWRKLYNEYLVYRSTRLIGNENVSKQVLKYCSQVSLERHLSTSRRSRRKEMFLKRVVSFVVLRPYWGSATDRAPDRIMIRVDLVIPHSTEAWGKRNWRDAGPSFVMNNLLIPHAPYLFGLTDGLPQHAWQTCWHLKEKFISWGEKFRWLNLGKPRWVRRWILIPKSK